MGLRFHPDGNQYLARWRENRSPSRDDQNLVTDVLRSLESGEGFHWYSVTDPSDDTVTIIEPREGLTVHVRIYDDQFELVRILPMTTMDPSDKEIRDN